MTHARLRDSTLVQYIIRSSAPIRAGETCCLSDQDVETLALNDSLILVCYYPLKTQNLLITDLSHSEVYEQCQALKVGMEKEFPSLLFLQSSFLSPCIPFPPCHPFLLPVPPSLHFQGSHSFTGKNQGLSRTPWEIFQDLFGAHECLNIKTKHLLLTTFGV